MNGPFLAGKYSDITIFRDSLITFLGLGKRVEVDDDGDLSEDDLSAFPI